MSLLPCSTCKKRPRGKLATVYASFFSGSQRFGKKGRYCGACISELAAYVRELKPIESEDESIEWPESCPSCGVAIRDDFDPTFLTIYTPKAEAVQVVLPMCTACATESRTHILSGMESTVDRQTAGRVEGATAPSHEAPAFPDVQWRF